MPARVNAAATAAVFTADGNSLLVGYDDGAVIAWGADLKKISAWIPTLERSVADLAISPDGMLLAVGLRSTAGQSGGALKIHSLNGAHLEVARFDGWDGDVRSVAFSRAGNHLAAVGGTANYDETFFVDLPEMRGQWAPWPRHHHLLTGVALSQDGKLAAVNCKRNISVWDIEAHKLIQENQDRLPQRVQCLALSQNGQALAAGCVGNNLDEHGIFSLWHGTPVRPTTVDSKTPQNGLLAVQFSPDDRLVVGSGADEAVYFWEAATGRLQTTIYPLQGAIRDLAFSPDGKRVVVVADRGVTAWTTPLSVLQNRRR